MNKENTEKLFNKYPKIFKQKDDSMKTTCMCWGFECGDGWYWLIDNLCKAIQGYIDDNKKPQVETVQVKEKFGTLSFYTTGSSSLVMGMIWLAEHMSGEICEACGSTKNVSQTDGWITTRCKNCIEKED